MRLPNPNSRIVTFSYRYYNMIKIYINLIVLDFLFLFSQVYLKLIFIYGYVHSRDHYILCVFGAQSRDYYLYYVHRVYK